MRSKSVFSRQATLGIALSLLVSASAVHGQSIRDGGAAVGAPAGDLSGTAQTLTAFDVDQWDHDIVKLTVGQQGVLVLSEEGVGAHFVSFDLSEATTITIMVTGPADLVVSLYGDDGTRLAEEARGVQVLNAGRYSVRIDGAQGAYAVTITGRRL